MNDLTHIGKDGRARMVDVGDKEITHRTAIAHGRICMSPATLQLAINRDSKKGDPVSIAELAGIMGAKRTAELIPLCHPLPLTNAKVTIQPLEDGTGLSVTATARTDGKTGVEMEALTGVSVACLTLYDMLKAVDRTMVIEGIELIEKTGGKSGDYKKAGT